MNLHTVIDKLSDCLRTLKQEVPNYEELNMEVAVILDDPNEEVADGDIMEIRSIVYVPLVEKVSIRVGPVR